MSRIFILHIETSGGNSSSSSEESSSSSEAPASFVWGTTTKLIVSGADRSSANGEYTYNSSFNKYMHNEYDSDYGYEAYCIMQSEYGYQIRGGNYMAEGTEFYESEDVYASLDSTIIGQHEYQPFMYLTISMANDSSSSESSSAGDLPLSINVNWNGEGPMLDAIGIYNKSSNTLYTHENSNGYTIELMGMYWRILYDGSEIANNGSNSTPLGTYSYEMYGGTAFTVTDADTSSSESSESSSESSEAPPSFVWGTTTKLIVSGADRSSANGEYVYNSSFNKYMNNTYDNDYGYEAYCIMQSEYGYQIRGGSYMVEGTEFYVSEDVYASLDSTIIGQHEYQPFMYLTVSIGNNESGSSSELPTSINVNWNGEGPMLDAIGIYNKSSSTSYVHENSNGYTIELQGVYWRILYNGSEITNNGTDTTPVGTYLYEMYGGSAFTVTDAGASSSESSEQPGDSSSSEAPASFVWGTTTKLIVSGADRSAANGEYTYNSSFNKYMNNTYDNDYGYEAYCIMQGPEYGYQIRGGSYMAGGTEFYESEDVYAYLDSTIIGQHEYQPFMYLTVSMSDGESSSESSSEQSGLPNSLNVNWNGEGPMLDAIGIYNKSSSTSYVHENSNGWTIELQGMYWRIIYNGSEFGNNGSDSTPVGTYPYEMYGGSAFTVTDASNAGSSSSNGGNNGNGFTVSIESDNSYNGNYIDSGNTNNGQPVYINGNYALWLYKYYAAWSGDYEYEWIFSPSSSVTENDMGNPLWDAYYPYAGSVSSSSNIPTDVSYWANGAGMQENISITNYNGNSSSSANGGGSTGNVQFVNDYGSYSIDITLNGETKTCPAYGGTVTFYNVPVGTQTITWVNSWDIDGTPQQSVTVIANDTVEVHFASMCFVKGTKIRLSNGEDKLVEDITYDDDLLVWDFDNGCYASAKPAWIKIEETDEEYLLSRYSNGAELKTVGPKNMHHEIFNADEQKFQYTDSMVGNCTMALDGLAKCISCELKQEYVKHYNIITKHHFNCFANGILTSCRLSKMYPIENMKYVKPIEARNTPSNLPKDIVDDYRLNEQPENIDKYVENFLARKK